MIVNDILNNPIVPFELDDPKLVLLFSYYLHLAPNINSKRSRILTNEKLDKGWNDFLTNLGMNFNDYHIYASGFIKDEQLRKYKLYTTDSVEKKSKRFICYYKPGETKELVCFLRHIRNSIAHGSVYLLVKGRKYILFDDYNTNNNLTARILLAQTDLTSLKKILDKL